jgi:predicted Zn-dependent protease
LCLSGDLALSKGDEEAAISSYRKAIAAQPNLSKPYLSLGNVYLQDNNILSAQQIFEQAKQNCSPEPDIFLGLAVIEERANKLGKAAEDYERAAALETELPRKKEIYSRLKELKIFNVAPINDVEPDQSVSNQPK